MKVLLVAINAKYIHSNLAVYSLKAYAEKYGLNKHQIKIKEYTINQYPEEILSDIYSEKADVVGFSCYIWNIALTKEVINDLKVVAPKTIVIVGGPEVSYNPRNVLMENPAIDYVMCQEGEEPFKEFLDNYDDELMDKNIKGLVYRQGNEIIEIPNTCPMDLSKVPFVYKDMKDFENKIIYYETSRGCPFSCSYCLSSIDKRLRFRSLDLVEKDDFLNMIAIAESTPGPMAVNSATYIGYHIAGFGGATAATIAVCIPSFIIIYFISLFFNEFLSLHYVACAFKGIQVCVVYLILTAGIRMLKNLEKNLFNTLIILIVAIIMIVFSITATSFSSIYYILICGVIGVIVYFFKKNIQR